MNLLVTNTRNSQAYSVIRALRPYAKKIVVTMFGQNRLAARLSHAANSCLVDKRYYVPSPVEDWRAGKIQRQNTEAEELYIQAVLKICEKENIDTIFPSFDPQVYVFSKNKERFEKLGILVPVPNYDVVVIPLDKYRTIQAAQETGFPCPKTYLINEPLLTLKVARGEAVEVLESWPAGTTLLCPIEDLLSLWIKLLDLLLYKFRAALGAARLRDPLNAPMGLKELMRSYKETYLHSDRKVYNLYFSHFFSDPMVSITWWLQTMSAVVRALKEIGR